MEKNIEEIELLLNDIETAMEQVKNGGKVLTFALDIYSAVSEIYQICHFLHNRIYTIEQENCSLKEKYLQIANINTQYVQKNRELHEQIEHLEAKLKQINFARYLVKLDKNI